MKHCIGTTQIVCQTGGQKLNLLRSKGQSAPQNNSIQEIANLFYGFDSLCKFLNSTNPTTTKPINSGRICFVKTICQLIFDQENVLVVYGITIKTVWPWK